MHERRAITEQIRNRFGQQRKAYEAQLAQILDEGRAGGLFEFDDLRLTVLAWFGMHNSAYQWLRREGQLDKTAVANAFYRIFMGGIATDAERVSLSDSS